MAITWGVVSFITNYIPNIGFVLGVVPPAILGLVDSGPWTALWVVLSYTAANFVIQSLIQPKFTGDAVGLNTTTTFLCLLFWSTVTGAMGTILAVPLTLFVKALLIDSDPRSRWVGIFLSAGDSPVRDPDELDQGVLDELDLDGDGVGEADPDYGRAVVESALRSSRSVRRPAVGHARQRRWGRRRRRGLRARGLQPGHQGLSSGLRFGAQCLHDRWQVHQDRLSDDGVVDESVVVSDAVAHPPHSRPLVTEETCAGIGVQCSKCLHAC